MKIVETFVQGKKPDQNLCEDVIVIADHYAAVIDGATDNSGATYNDITGGRYAAETLAKAIAELDGNLDAQTAIQILTEKLLEAQNDATLVGIPRYKARANVSMYSYARNEVWRVGDSFFRIGSKVFDESKLVDDAITAYRRAWTYSLLSGGMSPETILKTDPGAVAYEGLVSMQDLLGNNTSTPYGFGVLNGTPVPEQFIVVQPVDDAEDVVLASDGYLDISQDLAHAEKHLTQALAEDPLGLSLFGRCRLEGYNSFDDRAWIRLTV